MSNTDSYNNIPSEIWYKITQQLSQKDLIECQKVCKSWYLSTRQYSYCDNIVLKTVKNIVSFLNGFPNDAKDYVKSIVIGDQYAHSDPLIEYTLLKEQSKELLLSLPNLKKIDITRSFAKSIIYGINDEEFLMEFRKNHHDISSINVFETPYVCPEENCKSYNISPYSTNILMDKPQHDYSDYNLYRESYLQLEHLTMRWTFRCFSHFLHEIKMLPRVKYLDFKLALHYEYIQNYTNDNILRIIDEDQELKERLASIEKLHLCDYYHRYTNIIPQYFIGLNEIDTITDLNDLTSEFVNFMFSLDEYKCLSCEFYGDIDNRAAKCLKNNFIQNSTDNKKITKHLWFDLNCYDIEEVYSEDDYHSLYQDPTISILFLSKKINNNHLLKFARISVYEGQYNIKNIYEILNSEKRIINDINTLTFHISDNVSRNFYENLEEMYLDDYNTLQSIDQILSLTTDALKKVIINTKSCCKWSKYFVKYEKVNIYRYVTHLEVYVCPINGELLDDLTLPQLTVVFPCIKYLTLGYICDPSHSYIPNNNEIFINLPHINLEKLTLDASIFKFMAQEAMKTRKEFSDTHFILKVETSLKSYRYQVSLDSLNVNKLVENDKELDIRNSLIVHIILKDIECLEFNIYMLGKYSEFFDNSWYFHSNFLFEYWYSESKTSNEEMNNCRIYFE